MKFRKDREKSKVCPRCKLKLPENIEECPDCGLVFSRLDIATNKEAKRKKLRGDRDFIISTTKLPSDVSFIKLLLLCIFLGPFGAHNFYVGRYLKGAVLLTDFTILFFLVIFNSQIIAAGGETIISVLSTILGMIMLMWFWDLFLIIVKKYKVPVAIDIDFELENMSNGENLDNIVLIDETTNEIDGENKSSQDNDEDDEEDKYILKYEEFVTEQSELPKIETDDMKVVEEKTKEDNKEEDSNKGKKRKNQNVNKKKVNQKRNEVKK